MDGAVTDLDNSIIYKWGALAHCYPWRPERAPCLAELSDCLYERSRKTCSSKDLEEAIAVGSEALELRPSGHPDRLSSLRKLVRCFIYLFQRGPISPVNLEAAITLGQEALNLYSLGHPDRSSCVHALACFLFERFQKGGSS